MHQHQQHDPVNRSLQSRTVPAKKLALGIGFFLVGLFGFLDYLTGYEVSFSIFYLIPIVLVSWNVGRDAGILVCVASTMVWFYADQRAGHPYSDASIPIWNALVRLVFFLIVARFTVWRKQVQKEMLEREKEWAHRDLLSGVATKRALLERAALENNWIRRQHSPLTLAYIDVDNFRTFAQQFGYEVGNILLSLVGQTLQNHIRAVDLVARLEADEFAILLTKVDSQAARLVVGKLHTELLNAVQKHQWRVTFSIGVVTFADPVTSPEDMIKKTQTVMSGAKRAGKNIVKYEFLSESSGELYLR